MNKEAVTERLVKYEGSVPYMYKCTGDKVTVGVGHAIETAEEATLLAWNLPWTFAEDDYTKVAHAPTGNYAAAYYEPLTACRMADDDIENLCASDILLFENRLRQELPNWDEYPEPAQEALLDMAFNLGVAGLMKFPKMLAAVDEGDWETAAKESHRNGIPDERNEEIAGLFLACRKE